MNITDESYNWTSPAHCPHLHPPPPRKKMACDIITMCALSAIINVHDASIQGDVITDSRQCTDTQGIGERTVYGHSGDR